MPNETDEAMHAFGEGEKDYCKECHFTTDECAEESRISDDKCPGYLLREAERKGEEQFEDKHQEQEND